MARANAIGEGNFYDGRMAVCYFEFHSTGTVVGTFKKATDDGGSREPSSDSS